NILHLIPTRASSYSTSAKEILENAPKELINAKNKFGYTPLHMYVMGRRPSPEHLYYLLLHSSEKNIIVGFGVGSLNKNVYSIVTQFKDDTTVKQKFNAAWQKCTKIKQEIKKKVSEFKQELVKKKKITKEDMFKMHSLEMEPFLPNIAGKIREESVYLRGEEYTVKNLKGEIKKFLKLFNEAFKESTKHKKSYAQFEKMVKTGLKLYNEYVKIQPSQDGNKRVAGDFLDVFLHNNGYILKEMPKDKYLQFGYLALQARESNAKYEDFVDFGMDYIEKIQ
ncbi:MAG TPA: hypothetical protein VMW66_05125, partial [Elusimicrobiales bacterium]|nr:hypothetical protein [Elusimicrobiales bacterium]